MDTWRNGCVDEGDPICNRIYEQQKLTARKSKRRIKFEGMEPPLEFSDVDMSAYFHCSTVIRRPNHMLIVDCLEVGGVLFQN